MKEITITDKKQVRALIYHFYPNEPHNQPEPVCEIHAEPIRVETTTVSTPEASQTVGAIVRGCCADFINKRIEAITTEQESKRVKYFPDLTSEEWNSEDGADGRTVEVIIEDRESKQLIAQFAIKMRPAQDLPTCPKHGAGVEIHINADNEAAALAGNCDLKLVSCCKIALNARLRLIENIMGWVGYIKFKETPTASDSVQ